MTEKFSTKQTGLPDHIPVGSRWRERPPYNSRVVQVIGWDPDRQKVIIRGAITTYARADRFGRDYRREP